MLKKIKLHIDWLLVSIIFLGLFLRFFGITHGFPFIFHPDEPAVIRSALGIRFDPNPGHFDWPHLHFYLNYFLIVIFIKIRGLFQVLSLQDIFSTLFPLLWRDPLIFYLIGRSFDAILGAFSAIPVYLAGKKLFGRTAGLFAALSLVLMPYHVHTSHFALIDIPTTFWVSWAIYFSVKIFKDGGLKNYLWAGLFVGFAASTKYNGGLMALTVLTAHLLSVYFSGKKNYLDINGFKNLSGSGLFALLGFVIGTPYAVLDFKDFIRTDGPTGALWQFTNVGKVGLFEQLSHFFSAITYQYAENFGYVFIFIYTATLLYILATRKFKELWLLYLPSLFIFFYISGFSKDRAHYYLLVYPLVAIISGYMIYKVTKNLKNTQKLFSLILIFLLPFGFSLQRSLLLSRDDTKVQMYDYLVNTVQIGETIYYTSNDFVPVVEKFSENKVVKNFNNINSKGYILLGLDDAEQVLFDKGFHPESYFAQKYQKVAQFDNYGRRGVNIIIYKYE